MRDWSAHFDSSAPIILAQAGGESTTNRTTTTTTAVPQKESGGGGEHETSQWTFFGLSLLAFVIISVLAIAGTRRRKLIPSGLQNFMEWIYEGLYSIPEMVMGPRGRQYAPFVATFFLYIVVMNMIGLIPALKAGTASLSITLGLAVVAFITVQYYGFKAHGIKYLAHFVGPVPAMAFLILPLELISELVRPVSLSIRLYGNIFGEEQVIAALSQQLHPVTAVFMLPLQILTVFLQAFVFSLLVTVYIALATEKHEEHGESAETAAH
ncbi:MAG TPA: F0F1 ATP synthase subunit A [Armatimonadota bacterium]|nr:F0F1 ATP synthase subunit A [Armatimonadota bacterium]